MKLKIRTTVIAGAIAALLAGPTWAASDTPKEGAYTPAPTKAELGQPERDQPTAAQPVSDTPRVGAATYGSATAGSSIGDNPLYTRSADDLDGVEVVDSTGDKIGDVKQIVLAPDRKSALAVISAGGFLGMGARDIMVSLDELKPMDDKLQLNVTKAEIASLKDAEPDADKYAEVKGDTPISGSIVEFSAFEKGKEAVKPEAAAKTPEYDAQTQARAEIGQPERAQSTAAQAMRDTPRMGGDPLKAGQADVTPRMGAADHGTTATSGDAAGSSTAAERSAAGSSTAAERSAAGRSTAAERSTAAGSMAAGSRTTAGTSVGDNPLYTRSADDLDGVEVVDSTGDKIGDVKQIVLAPDRKSALAVISAGGFLGMGARDIVVSLDELRPMDDKLQMSATKEEIAALKDDAPDADKYVEVKGDTPISGSIVEFSAFEKGKEAVKPGAAPMTPQTDAYKPEATPETPKAPQ